MRRRSPMRRIKRRTRKTGPEVWQPLRNLLERIFIREVEQFELEDFTNLIFHVENFIETLWISEETLWISEETLWILISVRNSEDIIIPRKYGKFQPQWQYSIRHTVAVAI
jgi:hypothetical protein